MIFPILLSLWAACFASPSPQAHFSVSENLLVTPPTNADSAVFRQIQSVLDDHRANEAPEKIYLHLDRTFLQPGEILWFCAYLRNAGDLLPSLQSQVLYVELLDPRGSVMLRHSLLAFEGVAAGEFDFAEHLPGGLYKIRAYTQWMRNTETVFERQITLQKVVLPNLNLRLEFERKAFGPGDVVIARFDAQSLDNKPLAKQKILFEASVAGQNIQNGEALTDAEGRCYLRFALPEKLSSTDGLLNVRLEHQGQQEAISRAIPIVLNRVDVQFFPEGGDVVAEQTCRMAFKAVNEFGKPADVEGHVLDEQGQQVASFSSFHNGMGAFDFTPKLGEQYRAQVTKPFFSEKTIDIPVAVATGASLRLQKRDAQSLTFEVMGRAGSKMFLAACQQDKLVFLKSCQSGAQVVVPMGKLPMGVLRVTLFDENKHELAERLVFVGRDKGLRIDLKTDKPEYLPREEVNLSIQVRDHAGKPVQGQFSLAVADEKLLSFADDKQGHLLASLLLEQDLVGKIEEPNFYFDPKEPKSEQALDYLLLTQGWRRFEWVKVLHGNPSFKVAHQPERAEVAGTMWRKDGNPSWGGTVTLYPNGPSVKTTQFGEFSFSNVDLNRFTHLVYGHDQYHPIEAYSSDIMLHLPKKGRNAHFQTYSRPAPGMCVLQGNISDGSEGLIGATIKVMRGSEFVRGTITDYEGNYRTNLEPGVYDVEVSYTGFKAQRRGKISVSADKINGMNVIMYNQNMLEEVVMVAYRIPETEQDRTASAQTLTSDQIRSLPTRSVNTIVATTVGATSIDGGAVNIKGSRSGKIDYYVDGVRVSSINSLSPWAESKKAARKSEAMQLISRQPYHRARVFYAPKYEKKQHSAVERSDFRSTLYWNPSITTDQNGQASVRFHTSDAITNFRATLEGIGTQGRVGRAEQSFFVQKPLSLAMKVPVSVIAGDELSLQVALSNQTDYPTGGHLTLSLPAHFMLKPGFKNGENVQIAPHETKMVQVDCQVGIPGVETQSISAQFRADEAVLDAFEAPIKTTHRGFPVHIVASGKSAQNAFNIHLSDPVEGTVQMSVTAYPNALNDLLKTMERMLRQPNGCFEQVSSSTYPNLLVLDFLRSSGTSLPEVESRALTYLEDGYKKLSAYECKSGGFDWYGRDPGHEGLTAYGLMEFTDMSRVFAVDKPMLARTTDWLRSRRNGKGGWNMNPNTHGWQNNVVLEAYMAWAVAEAGVGKDFGPEIDQAYRSAVQSDDPYCLALLANALLILQDSRGEILLAKLCEKQGADGAWAGKTQSVFYSQGAALSIEATALATMALMKKGSHHDRVEQAMGFILKSKNEYGFGNTQSTVLALRALVQHAKARKDNKESGTLVVMVDGKKVGEQAFTSSQTNALEIKGLEKYFTQNDARVEVFFSDMATAIPFDLDIKYATRTPKNAPNCPLSFQTNLSKTEAGVGETVRLLATLQNKTDQTKASPMVVLGIPAGLSLQPWQLKKLVDEKHCDFYELWEGYAVFHFEKLGPNETRQLALDLRAEVPGTFESPASQAFLYYENEQRVWSKPERVRVRM